MNWTGGRLQRHSTTANSATQRQKQHFARVAQNLRSGPKFKSPVKWSIFDHVDEDRERSQHKSSAIHIPAASSREQSRSVVQRHLGHLDNVHVAGPHEVSESTKSVVDRVNQHVAKSHNHIKPNRVPDDDLYNATPPPQKLKQQREESVPLSEVESFMDKQEEETVLEKRRRLLRRGDWVGVSIQKPLQVAFASPRDEENIGRRRKVPHGARRARYETRQAHITSPFPLRARCPVDVAPSAWARQQQQLAAGKSDVRISIGGRVVPPGLSSSSIPRTFMRQKSQDTQSDVMLLDNTSSHEEQRLHYRHAQDYSLPSYNRSRYQNEASQLSPIYTQQEEPSDKRQIEKYPEDVDDWAGISSDFKDKLPDAVGDTYEAQLETENDTHFQSKKATPPRDLHNGLHPIQMVFSSSSASIHHPIPQSARISMLIRSGSPERAQSTTAQIGTRQPAVPSSQVEENEVWESWIAPLYQEPSSQDTNGLGNTRYHSEVNISPGISMVPPRGPFETSALSQYEDCYELEDLVNGENIEELSSDDLEPPYSANGGGSNEDYESSQLPQDVTTGVHTGTQPVQGPQNKVPEVIEKPFAVLASREEDADNIWRKFVFGSSSDALEEHGTTVMPSTYGWEGHQTVTESSMLAQPSTCSDRGVQKTAKPRSTSIEEYYRLKEESHLNSHPSISESQDLPSSNSASGRPNQRRISASIAVHASSSSEFASNSESNIYNRPLKKILFTKPKPFVGRDSMVTSLEKESLHIGRHLLDEEKKGRYSQSEEYDMYSIMTDNDRDEVESIEDA